MFNVWYVATSLDENIALKFQIADVAVDARTLKIDKPLPLESVATMNKSPSKALLACEPGKMFGGEVVQAGDAFERRCVNRLAKVSK